MSRVDMWTCDVGGCGREVRSPGFVVVYADGADAVRYDLCLEHRAQLVTWLRGTLAGADDGDEGTHPWQTS